ncbi:uncharacterized protein [Narcine bancroftii]|uniref:uncharacterized protein isoform X2 n=1 Tax=Narcine bancroftii TaxID=1343680 RepID=UPI00383217CA
MVSFQMPPDLMFMFFIALLPSVFTQENPNHVYIFQKENILLLGPNNLGNNPVSWVWIPHAKEGRYPLVNLHKDKYNRWIPSSTKYSVNKYWFERLNYDFSTVHLRIIQATFEFSGYIILQQTQPNPKILTHYEIIGIKAEASSHRPAEGSDVTLSCSISRLSDTVSLHWKQWDLSQQNRRNIEQIHLNNTVYLMIRHVAVGDENLFVCEVQENGTIVGTKEAGFSIESRLYRKHYRLYRSDTDHSEIYLTCYSSKVYNNASWNWSSLLQQSSTKIIAAAFKSQPVTVNASHFANRLEHTGTYFNGRNFNIKISPLMFEDGGVYKCILELQEFVTITVITVKVTAKPSHPVTERDTVTLTCSVSAVDGLTRLVWINGNNKTVREKRVAGKEKSVSVTIQKSDRGKGNWTCALFEENRLQLLVPYSLEFRDSGNQRQKPLKRGENTEALYHYLNATAIQQMQGVEKTVHELRDNAEYMSGNRKTKQEDTKEDIHYGSISFKNKTSGSRQGVQCSNQFSDANIVASTGNDFVIYAQIAQEKIE